MVGKGVRFVIDAFQREHYLRQPPNSPLAGQIRNGASTGDARGHMLGYAFPNLFPPLLFDALFDRNGCQ